MFWKSTMSETVEMNWQLRALFALTEDQTEITSTHFLIYNRAWLQTQDLQCVPLSSKSLISICKGRKKTIIHINNRYSTVTTEETHNILVRKSFNALRYAVSRTGTEYLPSQHARKNNLGKCLRFKFCETVHLRLKRIIRKMSTWHQFYPTQWAYLESNGTFWIFQRLKTLALQKGS